MAGELWARRASSFGAVAQAYADHRPGYPAAAASWAVAPVVGGRVLDLGAGTGKLTAALLRAGVAVHAVEPDAAMLAELRRLLPGVPAAVGRAEHIPLADAAMDAVLVGQAFHWFDGGPALDEIARVLRPGGVLALTGNVEDRSVPWVAELLDTIRSLRSPELAGSETQRYAELPEHPAFTERDERSFGWTRPRTVDAVVETVATHSWALLTPPPQRAEALAAIRAHLAARHPSGTFDLPMVTRVVRTRRR